MYADVLFLIDFCMDYLSLYATAKLLSLRTTLLRTVLAAVLGGIYGVTAVVLGITGIWGALLTVGMSFLMTFIAFGAREGVAAFLRVMLTVWGAGALLGGIMTAMGGVFGRDASGDGAGGIGELFIGALIAVFACTRFLRQKLTKGVAEVSITYEGKTFHGQGLIDSGNRLVDPLSGSPVVLVRLSAARTLLGEKADTVYQGRWDESGIGVRAVPVHTVGGTRILYGFFTRELTLKKGKRVFCRQGVVCVDPDSDGYGGLDALIPTALLL